MTHGPGPEAPGISPAEFDRFRRHVLALTQIDLAQYKPQQLLRRLATLPRRAGARDLGSYARLLQSDPKELVYFRGWLTINVTEFFRDPRRWVDLRDNVLPRLLMERNSLRVWSAACSNGAEPYSAAMLLADFRGSGPHYILATDIDPQALAIARAGGPYPEGQLENVTQMQTQRFLVRTRDAASWQVRPELRAQVTFRHADMMREPPDRDFDLIVCRNMIIYLTDEAKTEVLRRLSAALRPGGTLFLGGTELIAQPSQFGLSAVGPSFYRRRDA